MASAKTCNRCLKGGLRWVYIGAKWKLVESDGEMHRCGEIPKDIPLEVYEGTGGSMEQATTAGRIGHEPDMEPATETTPLGGVKAMESFSEAIQAVLKAETASEELVKDLAGATEQLLREAAKEAATKAASAGKQAAEQAARREQAMADNVNQAVEEARQALAAQMEQLVQPKVIELKIPHRDLTVEIDTGNEHKQYAQLMKLLLLGVHVFLPGQAGSGKTTAAIHAARDLKKVFQREDYEFLTISVTEMTSEARLAAWHDAQGRIVNTAFRRAYVEGHLFLLDEVDAGNPNVLAFVNMALSNHVAAFADGVYPVHEHFRCVVAGNTFGTGGSQLYVGRNTLDAAFLDRFYFLPWEVDERLELAVSQGYDVGNKEITAWVKWVQTVRAAHKDLGASAPQIVISPRASMTGAKLIAAGVHAKRDPVLEEALVWRGAKPEVRRKLGY